MHSISLLSSNGSQKQLSNPSDTENPNSILGKRKSRSSDDSGDTRPKPLIPTSSDSSVTDVIAMDFEMVGVSSVGKRSALGRVTLVNQWGNVIYDVHVRPVELVDFHTKISGIRPHHLKTAKDFRVAQKEVAELIKGRILVGHALRNDFKALLLGHQKQDIRDTSEYKHFLREGCSHALRNLATGSPWSGDTKWRALSKRGCPCCYDALPKAQKRMVKEHQGLCKTEGETDKA